MFDFIKEWIAPSLKEIKDSGNDYTDSAKSVVDEVVDSAKGFFDI